MRFMLNKDDVLLTWDLIDLVSWKPLTESKATRATVTRNCMNIVDDSNEDILITTQPENVGRMANSTAFDICNWSASRCSRGPGPQKAQPHKKYGPAFNFVEISGELFGEKSNNLCNEKWRQLQSIKLNNLRTTALIRVVWWVNPICREVGCRCHIKKLWSSYHVSYSIDSYTRAMYQHQEN